MDNKTLDKAKEWADNKAFDQGFRDEISQLIKTNDETELTDRFYKDLEFGTGGMRGVIGAGSNRMNVYTVRLATQGLANYILATIDNKYQKPIVAIAYDSRHFSREFAQEAACVLSANEIEVFVYSNLRPTPMLSYAVRQLKATAGIVITASHNPAEYNGYKAYWNDGCQITPPHDVGIIDKIKEIKSFDEIKYFDFQSAINKKLVQYIDMELEMQYYDKVCALSMADMQQNENFGVVFTPLHGTGNIPVRAVLKKRGFKKVSVVREQEMPDGNFPTVDYPNPEEASALDLAIKTAGSDDYLIIATDPDADRIGVMVKHQNRWQKLDGNQIGQLLLDYYLRKLKENNRLPADGVYATTIVTSTLGQKIADFYQVKSFETLTGFKYICGITRELEENKSGSFIFGTEESHGYVFDTFVRDKDAVMAAMIFAELCAELFPSGKTAIDRLEELHQQFGYHQDALVNKVIKGKTGAEKIREIMRHLRENPLKAIADVNVMIIKDYQKGEIIDCQTGNSIDTIDLPESNVLAYYLEDGSRITARPSGTEPKIKFYFNLCGATKELLQNTQEKYKTDFMNIIDSI